MENLLSSKRILFTLLLAGTTIINMMGQSDCMEKPEDLGSPIRSDTTRLIDPNTFNETIQITDVYIRYSQATIVKRDTSYHIDPSTLAESIEVTHTYHTQEISPDTIITKENTRFYYIQKDDCLKISHIIRRF